MESNRDIQSIELRESRVTDRRSNSLRTEAFFHDVPFGSRLSFLSFIDKLENVLKDSPDPGEQLRFKKLQELKKIEVLMGDDIQLVDLVGLKDKVMELLETVFPFRHFCSDIKGIGAPFKTSYIYATPKLQEILSNSVIVNDTSMGPRDKWRVLYGYRAILKKFYGVDFLLDKPVLFGMRNEETGLIRYFKLNADTQFFTLDLIGKLPKLSDGEINELLRNAEDLNLWYKKLPPEIFAFSGFSMVTYTDVTIEESIARMKYEVIQPRTDFSSDYFEKLEFETKCYFRKKNIRLGLCTLYDNGLPAFSSSNKINYSLALEPKEEFRNREVFMRSIYGRALETKQELIIENLEEWKAKGPIEKFLIKKGINCISIVPLQLNNNTIGLMEFSSTQPNDIKGGSIIKMSDLTVLFTQALRTHIENFETLLRNTMQKNFTNIHPSILWKFRESAISILENKKLEEGIVPVEFNGVIPFYGVSDIKSSSELGNTAISNDIIESLDTVSLILELMSKKEQKERCHVLEEKIKVFRKRIQENSKIGDSKKVSEFFKTEVNPAIQECSIKDLELRELIQNYLNNIDEENGYLKTHKSNFNKSVNLINSALASVFHNMEILVNDKFPVYSDLFKADGVEYSIYAGDSLSPQQKINGVDLAWLRFEQLRMAHNMMTAVNKLRDVLPVPLEVRHLVLAYSDPLHLKFNLDEKRFKVKGVDNVRFEIIKKRVDKALVKSSQKRLAKAGNLSVVYSDDRLGEAYRGYLATLIKEGYFKDNLEELELEDLQGVTGLKAIRVSPAF